jgi:hypothetical protein
MMLFRRIGMKPEGWMAKKMDLMPSVLPKLDWTPANSAASLDQMFDRVMAIGRGAVAWYVTAKKSKRFWARQFRVLVILLGAAAALLPTIGELLPQLLAVFGEADGAGFRIPAGWTIVLLGLAGVLLLLDRFFGFSSAWVRYVATELQLTQMCDEFQMDWEAEKAVLKGEPPSQDQVAQMMAKCRAFATQVHNIVRDETRLWVQEFEKAVREIDDTTKSKSAVTEPGSINLTVTNGNTIANGWRLQVDGGAEESYRGLTAAKRNLIPGAHMLSVSGEVGGKIVRAEKVVAVAAGEIREESLTLS